MVDDQWQRKGYSIVDWNVQPQAWRPKDKHSVKIRGLTIYDDKVPMTDVSQGL